MAKTLTLIALLLGVGAAAFYVVIQKDPTPQVESPRDRISRISPTQKPMQQTAIKPYLMIHIEDLTRCFPEIVSAARPENLVSLEDIMVEVDKVFLPSPQVESFHELHVLTQVGEKLVLRHQRPDPRAQATTQLFEIDEQGAWQERKLPNQLTGLPKASIYQLFEANHKVTYDEQRFQKQGRGGEQIRFSKKNDRIVELGVYSASRSARLECSLREKSAILCICEMS